MMSSIKSSRAALVLAAAWVVGGCASEDLTEGGAESQDPGGVYGAGQAPGASGVDVNPFAAGGDASISDTVTDGVVELDWSVPATTDSVALVRRFGRPVSGSPSALELGEELVFAGRALSYSDSDTLPGRIHYTLFARASGSSPYVGVAYAIANVPLPTQTGTLVVSLAPSTNMIVSAQPANVTLSGSAAWDFETSRLTVTLGVTNGAARILFNPKVKVTAANQGVLTEDGTIGGSPFRYYGPDGLDAGATGTRTLVFEGVTGDIDPIVLSVELVDAPMLVVGNDYSATTAYQLVDSATMRQVADVPCDELVYAAGNENGRCAQRSGALSADAGHMYTGHRSMPIVRRISLANHTVDATAVLDAGLGFVDGVVTSADGLHVYAVLNLGAHAAGGGSANGASNGNRSVALVRMDAETLNESGRIELAASSTQPELRGRRISMSPDGTIAAVPTIAEGKVHLIDLATFTEIDTDDVAEGAQGIDVSSVYSDPKQAVFTPDGLSLYVNFRYGDQIAKVDLATHVVTGISTTATDRSTGAMAFAADGRLWIASGRSFINGSSLALHNPGPEDCTTVATDVLSTDSVAMTADGRAFVSTQGKKLLVFDTSTAARIDTDGATGNGTTDVELSTRAGQHWMLVTPF